MDHPVIEIVPVGEVPAEILQRLLPAIEAPFPGHLVRLAAQHLRHPDYAFSSSRSQYRSEPILDRLVNRRAEAERVLGVADLDLYTPGLNFIFGQAQKGGPAAVIALARLHPEFWGRPSDPQLLLERFTKEAIHELGHTYGLDHCLNPTCVMRFSNTLEETDLKSDEFCAKHRRQLQGTLRVA